MFDLSAYLLGLAAACVLLTVVWLVSLIRKDASIVDPFWGLVFVPLGATYRFASETIRPEARIFYGFTAYQIASLLIAGLMIWLWWRESKPSETQSLKKLGQP